MSGNNSVDQAVFDEWTGEVANALDSMWILLSGTVTELLHSVACTPFCADSMIVLSRLGFLVFFMQAGFAMLEVGAVRSKNAQNILLKNVFDIAVGAILWWLLGYGFAYGTDSGGFIGNTSFAGTGDDFSFRDWFFQWAFAATVSCKILTLSDHCSLLRRTYAHLWLCALA